MRRCLAASYAQLLMKQVISTVVSEADLRAVDPRSERARKSAIAFVPHRHALVIATRRERAQPAQPLGVVEVGNTAPQERAAAR